MVKHLYKDPFNHKFHKKIIFCNGGDRTAENIPEQERYKKDEWVDFEFGVGGENKKNSSSWILEDYKNAKTIRNWGYYRVIHKIGKGVKVKELVIEPGQSLSNQYHNKRNELWYVMKGEVVMNGVVQKEHGPAFLIPKEYWHHAINVSDKPCHILECQYGEECIEEDIIRQPLDENDSH
jgi:mannose-6-phosphate isomerase-like protein (cupin superfamily)